MFDHVIRNARLPDHAAPVDIGFAAGRIAAIEASLPGDAPGTDAEGRLCCAGFVETHIHLDKSRIINRCSPAEGRNAMAVKRVAEAKKDFTVEDVIERATATLENCIKHGTTRMRTHVEVDPGVGMRGFEGVKAVAEAYRWAIDVELCIFPQEGLTNNPGTEDLIVAGLEAGARVIGAAPGYDSDSSAQIRRIFELALAYDVDIDMHLDFGNSAEAMDTHLVCELTERHGLGGRVAIGHATKLSTLPPAGQIEMAKRLAGAGVAVTVLPATDLFLMGRDQDHNVRRGVVDANLFTAHGCRCSIATNNILNPFTPFGDCSPVRMANLHANILQVGEREKLAECFAMLTSEAAALMNLRDYGVRVGNPADVVIVDADEPAQAVAEITPPLAVFKNGRRTVTRPRAELHRPD